MATRFRIKAVATCHGMIPSTRKEARVSCIKLYVKNMGLWAVNKDRGTF